jgi:hypothetical protein
MPKLKPSQLAAQIRSIRRKLPDAEVIGIRSRHAWDGGETVSVDGFDFGVRQCASELDIRDFLSGSQRPIALVTLLQEKDLAADVLVRLAKRRLFSVDEWSSVRDLFDASIIDPTIVRKRWLAETLLECMPAQGYKPAPNGVLTAELVWNLVLEQLLGIRVPNPDVQDLLAWTLTCDRFECFRALSAECQKDIVDRVELTAGRLGRLVFQCISAGSGRDALPLGLACEVLFPDGEAPPELQAAAVRLEHYTGKNPIPRELGAPLAKAALTLCRRLQENGGAEKARTAISRLDLLLKETGADGYAWLSSVSPAGFEQRLTRYGTALAAALQKKEKDGWPDLWPYVKDVREHTVALRMQARVERVEMSVRLVRWLAARMPLAGEKPNFAGVARGYSQDGGFVDWAMARLASGEGSHELATAYAKLIEMAAEPRAEENQFFAQLLAEGTKANSSTPGVLRIEEVLDRVVAEIARTHPVLLIVVDGMSFAVFRELLEDLVLRQQWLELGRTDANQADVALAVLPSITEVSRCSLLCGRLASSAQEDEANGFSQHPRLLEICKTSPPVLFRKSELLDAGGPALASGLRKEIASSKRRVVGAVINAVDDYLYKGEQIAVAWRVGTITALESLLHTAQEAGRIVILTSDHGHVLERNSELRRHDGAEERYRADDGKPGPDEVVVSGPRVVLPPNHRMIAPWSDQVRYGAKRTGYHGGVSPQEMLVPVCVLTRQEKPDGWEVRAHYQPAWWDLAGRPAAGLAVPQPYPVVPETESKTAELPLFQAAKPANSLQWVEQLLTSPVLANQEKQCGRTLPSRDRIRVFLGVMNSHGFSVLHTALAQDLQLPLFRMQGLIRVMQRLLNVEGYAVLSYDSGSGTVTLNYELLRTQFEMPSDD